MIGNNTSKRAFARDCCEAQIQYSVFNQKEEFFDAKMYNTSEGGLYFESKEHLPTGVDIRIKINGNTPHTHKNEAKDGYRGEVVWCRRVYRNGASVYGVGIRFIVNICDKCNEKVPYSEIHRTDNYLFLCSKCMKDVMYWTGGKINECLERYLNGNVL